MNDLRASIGIPSTAALDTDSAICAYSAGCGCGYEYDHDA
jgi:hypothetical protein